MGVLLLTMKKIFLLMLCIVILSNFITATCSNLNNATAYFSFDTDCVTDVANSYDGNNNGADNQAGGLINNGCMFKRSETDYVDITNVLNGLNIANPFSISVWVNFSTTSNNMWVSSFGDSNLHAMTGYNGGASRYEWSSYDNGLGRWNHEEFASASDTTSWHHLVVTFDTDGGLTGAYIDNSAKTPDTAEVIDLTNIVNGSIGCRNNADQCTDGMIDEVAFFPFELDSSQISDLYNSGSGCNPYSTPPTGGTEPSLELFTDLINSTVSNQTSHRFFFNGTSTNNSNIYDCSFLVNETINQTNSSIDLSNQNSFLLEFNYEFYDWMNFTINCSNENASSLESKMFFIDVIEPLAVSNFVNHTLYYDEGTSISYQINFTDVNLFAFNHSIFASDGSEYRNDFLDNINTSFYSLDVLNSSSGWSLTNYTIQIKVWDSHTTKELKEKPFKSDTKIYYKDTSFYCDDFEDIDFILDIDKIKIKVKFKSKKDNVCYYNGKDFIKVETSSYPNHWVDVINDVWIDDYDGNIIREDKDTLKITYFDKKEIITESIGDLNVYELEYSFSVVDTPDLSSLQLESINQNVSISNTYLNEISGGINMIGLIILWLGLFALGYYAIQTHNDLLGITLILLTIPIDVWFAYTFQESNHLATGFIGIAFAVMAVWTTGIVVLIKRNAKKSNTPM